MSVRRSAMYSEKSSYRESVRSDAYSLCQNQFIANTDKRVKSGKAQSLEKLFRWTYEKNLQQKRGRLKDLLSMEAKLYQEELTNDFKTKADEELKSREQRLLGLKAERERHRLKFAEEMKVQQLINSCDEIRPYLRQKLQDECKNCQRLQIEDNNLKKIEELDQDRIWYDVQKQVFNQMTQRELEESLVAHNRNLKDQQILRKQMSEKNENDTIKEDEYEEDTMNCGKVVQVGNAPTEQELLLQYKQKQRQFAQDLLSQQGEKARTKRDLRNCEIMYDLALIDIARKEIDLAEQNSRLEKKQNMKETLHFLGYTKTVEKEKLMAEREKEILTENLQNEKNKEYLKNRNYFQRQRDEFNKRIHEERWKQIMDKKERLRQEKNHKIKEIIEANKAYAYNAFLESELIKKNKNFRRQYGYELRAQSNYEKLLKEKTATSSNNLSQTIEKEEANKTELIKNNLGRIHTIYPVHPNFNAILNSKK